MDAAGRIEVASLTEEYGGAWGINHTRRLLHLISIIGADQSYDADVVWMAAHLHDWGAYSKWAVAGVDHALRSKQVAEEYLAQKGYPAEFVQAVLECIEFHHQGNPNKRIEAILLSDADGLDFLGVVGILRDFSKTPRDMRKAFETVQGRVQKVPQMLCLDKSQAIAAERLRRMEDVLAAFGEETAGCF